MYRTAPRQAPLDFPLPSPHSTYNFGRREEKSPPYSLRSLPPFNLQAPVKNGLRTPPADDMATAYQNPSYSNAYSAGRNSEYISVDAPPSNFVGTYNNGASTQPRQYTSWAQPPTASASILRKENQGPQPVHSQPQSPIPSQRPGHSAREGPVTRRKSTSEIVRPNLQIPKSISSHGGSLAEFAAQITCLFWFESTETLHRAEKPLAPSATVKRIEQGALPSSGFRKWVVTILSTTQVADNVILLALLFIYRLKTSNPAVKGNSGSEYRLLTVALMLGNKFLDDNTYTNKTWAEVSGISVGEIHVMEVEFLSNMRYSLLASSEQWAEWHEKLRNIRRYCIAAAEAPTVASPQQTHTHPNIPSPPSTQGSPPSHPYLPPSTSFVNGHPWPANNSLPPISSPLSKLPDLQYRGSIRKRSIEGDAEEPVAKRISSRPPMMPAQYTSAYTPIPTMRSEARRLPVPDLTIATSQPMSSGYSASTPHNAPVLPPLNGRAMSTVYPVTPSSWAPQVPLLTPSGSHHASGYSTPSRRQSPQSVQDLLSHSSSPTAAHFPDHNHPKHFSPSFFLQQRSSPYRPVRYVNTLLHPPPSASMHGYSINTNQIMYQPLGKRNDNRVGIVPDYNHTPYQQQWPPIRQPNFHA
ncbi:cyclin [Diplocarpon rosae]|nr:cyclin [Diplocarpon rosae]